MPHRKLAPPANYRHWPWIWGGAMVTFSVVLGFFVPWWVALLPILVVVVVGLATLPAWRRKQREQTTRPPP